MSFAKGDVVAVRKMVPGTFGGMEPDWRAGIYEGERDGKCVVSYLPVSKEFWHRNEDEVLEDDLMAPDMFWPWLKGIRMMKVIENG